MTAADRPLVVLTPVRNDAWILDRFLAVTARVADSIVVADQGSTDGSREMCSRHPKVHLIDNPSPEYDEAARQRLLLQAARERCPGDKVLLALDADEIVSANAPAAEEWRTMLAAPAGTVLCIEKPDLYLTPERCIRFDAPWPLGYVDDGAEHSGRPVHNLRLPVPEGAPRLELREVKVLHYALTRPGGQAAKMRLYSVLENLHRTSPLYLRRLAYARDRDWRKNGRLDATPPEWLAGWEAEGIDLRTVATQAYYWQDFEVLRHFRLHGCRRFWLEDIWSFDWQACRRFAEEHGEPGIPGGPIVPPPAPVRLAGRLLDVAYRSFRSLRGNHHA